MRRHYLAHPKGCKTPSAETLALQQKTPKAVAAVRGGAYEQNKHYLFGTEKKAGFTNAYMATGTENFYSIMMYLSYILHAFHRPMAQWGPLKAPVFFFRNLVPTKYYVAIL